MSKTDEILERQMAYMENLEKDALRRRQLDESHLALSSAMFKVQEHRNDILVEILNEIKLLRVTGLGQ